MTTSNYVYHSDEWIYQGYALPAEESKVLEIISGSVSNTPRSAKLCCLRALAYNRLGFPEHAIQACNTAIAYDSRFSDAYLFLGDLLSQTDRPHEALYAYAKALRMSPNPDLFLKYGNLLIALGYFVKASELMPKLIKNSTWQELVLKARIHECNGEIKQAVDAYLEARQGYPDNPEVFRSFFEFSNRREKQLQQREQIPLLKRVFRWMLMLIE